MKIAVFVSGRGSNLNAILNSPDLKNLVEVIAVVSDKIDCKAFTIAKKFEIKTHPDASYAGAIGAALWGGYRHLKLKEKQAVAV